MQFSKELIQKIKIHYNNKYGMKLTDVEANDYLQNLATLGSIACNFLSTQLTSAKLQPCEVPHVPHSNTAATKGAVVESGRVGRSRSATLLEPLDKSAIHEVTQT